MRNRCFAYLRKMCPKRAYHCHDCDMDDELIQQALAAGAHDFIWKPLRPHEVSARLQGAPF